MSDVSRETLATGLSDYLEFVRWHVDSGDIDPVYPVLRLLHDQYCMTPDEQVALSLLYVAYYNLPSALSTWFDGWRPGMALAEDQLRRPTGTERRAHRNRSEFARHIAAINAVCRRHGLANWLNVDNWTLLQGLIQSIHGNGRWAGYKIGEILHTVHGWPAAPPDAGHADSSGPRKGLADLFPPAAALTGNSPAVIRQLDAMTTRLQQATGLPVEQVETTLCDWHSVVTGRYYVGHDIDLMLAQTRNAARRDVLRTILFARQRVFDPLWLGEIGGWTGVRKHLNRLYVDHRLIRWWT